MQIGEVAKATGLTVDTVRFYEKQRLLRRPPRSEGGFRLFSPEDVETIEFIRHAQQLGFSLQEIRELLVLRGSGFEACSHVRDLLRVKLSDVRAKIEHLHKLEHQLMSGLRECEVSAGAHCEAGRGACPVLQSLAEPIQEEKA